MRTLVIFFASILTCPILGQKVPDIRLDTARGESTAPQIATSGSAVYVAWQDFRAGNFGVYFNRSTDGGASWLASDVQVNTDPGFPGYYVNRPPAIAASGSSVFVVWADYRNGWTDVFLNRSLDDGVTWLSSEVRLDTDPAGSARSEQVQIVASGPWVYVTWEDRRNGSRDVYFNRSPDRGATWLSSDVRLDTDAAGSAMSERPRLVASGASVYVTWQDQRNDVADVYFNRSLDGGSNWLSSDVRVNTDPIGATASFVPQIAMFGSSVYVVWAESAIYWYAYTSSNSGIWFNRSLDMGATWLPSQRRLSVNSGRAVARSPRIAASGSSIYVAWEDRGGLCFNRSADRGTTWLLAEIKVGSNPVSGAPELAVSGSSVFATWRYGIVYAGSTGPYPGDVYFNRSLDAGVTWLGSDVRLNSSIQGYAGDPQITSSASSVYVVWPEVRMSSDVDIYFNIPFGFQPYGAATPGSAGIAPGLSSTGHATIGSTPSLDITDGLGGTVGALVVGAKATVPVPGGTLLVSPVLSLPIALGGGALGTGTASVPLRIPDNASLIGTNVNFQAVLLDAAAAFGFSTTNGVEMWIG